MSEYQYFKNIVVLSVLWSATVFSSYLISFMTKNFEGNIYTNYYMDGIAGIVGTIIAQPLYNWIKIRWTFVIALIFTILFVTLLMLFQ